jgi:imidazolonepropionase-like amidohydrolase
MPDRHMLDRWAGNARLGILWLVFVPLGIGWAQPIPSDGATFPERNDEGLEPTFLIFKYQHIVGKEIDQCSPNSSGTRCHAHFQLDFTGSSISLDADIQTDASSQPISYSAKGSNSTRSFVDLDVAVEGKQATVRNNGEVRIVSLPSSFFTLQEDVPFLTQELLFGYWLRHQKPERIALMPEGEVRIRRRGITKLPGGGGETLTRYSVHGVTWGDETVWLNVQGQIAAVVGADAEEDRVEVLRPRYQPALKELAKQAAADAVADLEDASRKVKPIALGTFALTHATVINPGGNKPPEQNVTVLISDGKITGVGKDIKIPAGAKVIDVAGKFVLPGLWDTHAHFEQWEWGPAYLASGITSVRDVGNEIEFLVPIRAALNAGRGLGPHMYAAGVIDSDPGSLTSEHAEDAETARKIVGRYHELGYEELKIYQSLKPELIPVVTAEAHRLGMQVTGHIPTGTDALTAVRDGMDQINHVGFVARVMRPQGATSVRSDSPEAQAAIQVLHDHHTVIEPTLARSEFNTHPRRRPFSEFEPSVQCLPPELAVILNNAGVSDDREARAAAGLQAVLDTTKILHDAGVPILAGSDQVVPGFSVHRELELLVRAGLSASEALRAATSVPATVLAVPDLGAVEAGKRADLVVLDRNPLDDISNVRRVYLTIAGGKVYEPNALRSLVDIQAQR